MPRILCLHWPAWPIQRLLAARPELDRRRPLFLHTRDPRRGHVVAHANRAALASGIRAGQPLAEAATLAQAEAFPVDEAADLAALARLAEYAECYSSLVGWKTVHGPAIPPQHLFLDITGTAPLFGDEARLVRRAVQGFARQGYEARAGLGETCGAAWAEAVFAEPLPVAALRLPGETVQLLNQLGIMQLAHLLQLPRASLPARFGPELLLRLDQFLGTAGETIVPHRPPPEFIVERSLEFPTEQRELVEIIVRELVEKLAPALAEKRRGAVQLACHLLGRPPRVLRVGLFRPSAQAAHWWDLLRAALEQKLPSAIERITLAASLTAPLPSEQPDLFGANQHESARQLALLVDRLSGRLGSEAVLRPRLTADPLPERAVRYVPLLESSSSPARPAKKKSLPPPPIERPLLLRTPPVALAVMSVVPDGPPISFSFARQNHRVARSWGPERIESGWWRGPSVRRDYYRVETEAGLHYWLFRQLADGSWHLHGEFA